MFVKSFIFCSLVIFSMDAFSEALENELLLGQSGVFTGVSSELGTDLWKGANAYFSYINSKGGVNGKKIKVITKDDAFNGQKSLANTIDFVKNKKVFALFDYLGTEALAESLPGIQKFSEEGVFLFSNFSGGQLQREKPHAEHVFNIRASYWQETQGLVEHFYKIGKKRFGLFIQYDTYGRIGADGVRTTLKTKKLDVLAQASYRRGQPFEDSMMDQVKSILKNDVDVIIIVGSYAASAAFIRDARNSGYKGVIANVSGVGPDALLDILVKEEKKTKKNYTFNLVNSQVVPPPSDSSYKLVQEHWDIMDKFGASYPGDLGDNPKNLSFTTLEGFLNAKVFVEILKNIKGEVTRESFYKTARSLKDLDVGLGKDMINFSNPASQGLSVIYYTTITDGRYMTIKDWNKIRSI